MITVDWYFVQQLEKNAYSVFYAIIDTIVIVNSSLLLYHPNMNLIKNLIKAYFDWDSVANSFILRCFRQQYEYFLQYKSAKFILKTEK